MTVKELIEKLQTFSPDVEVIVDDISGGSYDIKGLKDDETVIYIAFDSDDEEDKEHNDEE